jgi:CubicO group peptidase (beta-lactamase class C family)
MSCATFRGTQMCAVLIRLVAVLSVLALFPFAADGTSAGDPGSDCGNPSDIHDGWSIGSPEQQGVDRIRLCAMGKGVMNGNLANVDSIVVVRHGVLIYERYFVYPNQQFFDATIKHVGNSMIKSVISILLGIAVDRGMIKDLDTPVFLFFPEYADLRSPEKDRITLRNLLTMSAGLEWHEFDTPYGDATNSATVMRYASDPYRYVLEQRMVARPGGIWNYNSGTSSLIGAILTRATGKPIEELARTLLFEPLGIDDIAWSPRMRDGFGMLWLRPRDWAKIGQLVLNRGVWQGSQIVSADWLAQSTTEKIKARERFSYGYQWWLGRSLNGDRVIEWTAALGFNSQKIIIIPDLDMVVVFNASHESINMVAPEIELLDQYILPAILEH